MGKATSKAQSEVTEVTEKDKEEIRDFAQRTSTDGSESALARSYRPTTVVKPRPTPKDEIADNTPTKVTTVKFSDDVEEADLNSSLGRSYRPTVFVKPKEVENQSNTEANLMQKETKVKFTVDGDK